MDSLPQLNWLWRRFNFVPHCITTPSRLSDRNSLTRLVDSYLWRTMDRNTSTLSGYNTPQPIPTKRWKHQLKRKLFEDSAMSGTTTQAGDASKRTRRQFALSTPTGSQRKRVDMVKSSTGTGMSLLSGPTLEQEDQVETIGPKPMVLPSTPTQDEFLLGRFSTSTPSNSLGATLKYSASADGIPDDLLEAFENENTESQDFANDRGKHWPIKAILWSKPGPSGELYLVQWGRGIWKPTWLPESRLVDVDSHGNTSSGVLLQLYKQHQKDFALWRIDNGGANLKQAHDKARDVLESVGEHILCRSLSRLTVLADPSTQHEYLVFNCLQLVSAIHKATNADKRTREDWYYGSDEHLGVLDYRRFIEWLLREFGTRRT